MTIRETQRLHIRHFTKDDAKFYHQLVNTPSWLKYIGDRNLQTIEAAENYLLNFTMKSYETLGFGFYLVHEKKLNKAIGTCGIIKRDQLEYADIGFAFLPEFESHGYGFESASAIIEHAKYDLKLSKISAFCTKENFKSIALIKKLGMHYEKKIQVGDSQEILNLYLRDFVDN